MEEKNELNDIILNRGTSNGSSKKVLVAVATLVIILIVVVVIMNRINSSGTENLPQAILPPEPIEHANTETKETLFEPVEVIEENPATQEEDDLDKIAQKLKEESLVEEVPDPTYAQPKPVVKAKPVVKKKPVVTSKPKPKPVSKPKVATKGSYYVQVGSFTRFEPNKQFLASINTQGFSYKYHKATVKGKSVNKVLVGPFATEKEARSALKTVRAKIEKGAFLTKI